MLILAFGSVVALSAPSSKVVKASDKKEETESQELLVERERRRLEEVFIWKMSEELRLPVEKETAFAEAIRALNRDKAKANLEVTRSLESLAAAQSLAQPKARTATAQALKRYEKAWRAYGQLPIREISRIRSILGDEKLGRYLLAKAQMTERLKSMSAREASQQTNETVTEPANSR